MTQDKQNAFAVMVGRIEDQLTVIPILTKNVLETESAEWLQRFAANVAELLKAAERAIAEAKAESEPTWHPIRTAPKDGTWFLSHQAGDDGVIRISSARWDGEELGGKAWCYSPHSMPQYWMPISERFAE